MKLNVGSPLAGGPFSDGRLARQPVSAKAPARRSKPLDGFDMLTASTLGALSLSKRRRPYTPNGVGGHGRDRGSSE